MVTRCAAARARGAALAVLEGLVGVLREEYLVLLPESLPFLAELLEDPELSIKSSTQALILKLETLSGESLADYLKP